MPNRRHQRLSNRESMLESLEFIVPDRGGVAWREYAESGGISGCAEFGVADAAVPAGAGPYRLCQIRGSKCAQPLRFIPAAVAIVPSPG